MMIKVLEELNDEEKRINMVDSDAPITSIFPGK